MAKTDAELIDELGGATGLAARLTKAVGKTLSRERVQMWKTIARGVPASFRPLLEKMAVADGVDLPPNFLTPTT